MPTRILVPLDGSDLSSSVLEQLMPLAQDLSAEIILLHIVESTSSGIAEGISGGVVLPGTNLMITVEKETERSQEYLAAIASRLRAAGLKTQELVRTGRPARTIVECANDIDASLIAMTTHGRTGILRTVLGSVANDVLRTWTRPILLLRPKDPGQDRTKTDS